MAGTRLVLSGTLLLAAAQLGCDTMESPGDQADRRVRSQVAQATGANTVAQLQKAVGETGATAESTVHARAMLASALASRGTDALSEATRTAEDFRALMRQAQSVALHIADLNSEIGLIGQRNPQDLLAKLEAQANELRGDGGEVKLVKVQGAGAAVDTTVPTSSFAKQEISRLEGQIATRKAEVEKLNAERLRLVEQSAAAFRAADAGQKQAWVDEYKRAAELKQQAEAAQRQIDRIEDELRPLRQELTLRQQELAVVEQALEAVSRRQAELKAAWERDEAAMADRRKKIAALVEATDGTEVTLAKLAASSAEVLGRAAKQREEGQRELGEATKLYEQCVRDSDTLQKALQVKINAVQPDDASAKAWAGIKDAMHPHRYRLLLASVLQERANGLRAAANDLGQQTKAGELVTRVLAGGPKAPPAFTGGEAAAEMGRLQTEADALLKQASELQETAMVGSRQFTDAARVANMLLLYDWAMLARERGDMEAAVSRLRTAVGFKRDLENNKVRLPVLPEELAGSTQP